MDATGHYLNEIGRWPLLTAAQEIILARLHQKGLQARRELNGKRPTKAQRHIMRVGDRAGQRIVLCNLRLGVSIAKKYTRICRLNDFDDLIQYAAIGLQRAAAKFDPERGYKFSTYATKWIRQEVGRGIFSTDSVVYLPERQQQQWLNLGKKAATFAQQYNRSPRETELLDGTDFTPERYREVTAVMAGRLSLDAPVSEDGATLGDFLAADDSAPPPSGDYSKLLQCIEALPEKDRDTIKRRYGLDEHHGHTLSDIATAEGVTRGTVWLRVTRIQRQLHSALS